MKPLPVWARATGTALEIRVKVVPGASKPGIAGVLGDRLKVRVAAPPEKGRANADLLRLLADALSLPAGALVAGAASQEKTLRFAPVDEETLERIRSFQL